MRDSAMPDPAGHLRLCRFIPRTGLSPSCLASCSDIPMTMRIIIIMWVFCFVVVVFWVGGGGAFYVPDTVLRAFMLPHYSHRNPSNATERVLRHRDMKQPV